MDTVVCWRRRRRRRRQRSIYSPYTRL